ncbi:glutathione-disulfide reductase [Reinekea marinisedimentorum]|uniref:Glutathione reductase (NADPH) n=1 Tax=Reinekea marinisedimentorum TaxID=230495 RepID=A0A4R3I8E7_9GAMM|nr:glutathione-disulfide reductase [Reinekea marinisedimentorum]TCS42533.1 glutathione reductase (NADPH) [Reinekea marinisedimentorum]
MNFDYDLLVIGAGSGGVRAARVSAQLGAKVAVVESRYLGGTCVNVGCVPKKLFVYASEYSQSFKDSAGYGYTVDEKPRFDWAVLRDNKTTEIERLNGIYRNILENNHVRIINGHACFKSAHEVQVGDQTISARNILIATGSWPFKPAIPGNEHILTSNEFFYMDKLPERMIVVGGGYIAVEFAGILNGLGVETHIVYRGETILRGFDNGVRAFVSDELQTSGVRIHYHSTIEQVDKQDDGSLLATLNNGETLTVGEIICATGRKALVDPLNLDAAGVQLSHHGNIDVNDQYQTNIPNIYAVGDVIGRAQLTPVAIKEGMFVAQNLFGENPKPVNYSMIPTAVFCQPNIGTVGLTEEQAAAQYDAVEVYEAKFRPMKNTLSGSPHKVLMKMLVDAETRKVIGCHMAGNDAGEIIQGIGVAMQAGATKEDFDNTVAIHPTAAEEFVTMSTVSRIVGRKA